MIPKKEATQSLPVGQQRSLDKTVHVKIRSNTIYSYPKSVMTSVPAMELSRVDSDITSGGADPLSRRLSDDTASHIHEFGDTVEVIHVRRDSEGTVDVGRSKRSLSEQRRLRHGKHLPYRSRVRYFRRSLFRKRKLMQYFYNDVLFRSKERRQLTREELFLDLVLVASIAALGHHLRAHVTWHSMQTFILLFTAIYSAWRETVLLWNFWGLREDLPAKCSTYLVFVCISGISVAGLDPFSDNLRRYVSLCAFFATFIPVAGHVIWSSMEPLLKVEGNRVNMMWLSAIFTIVGIIPYFIAAFVTSGGTAKALFFAALILQPIGMFSQVSIYHLLHRKVDAHSRVALSINHIVEKLEVMTLIFLGESAISFLAEAGSLVAQSAARVHQIYLCAVFSSGMLYGLQTLYVQVDSAILRGGVHALRYDQYAGLVWGMLHYPYHLSLMLFATGLGIGIRDIVVPPSVQAVHAAVSSSAESATAELNSHFSRSVRWCFAIGWAGSLIFSALISATHVGGPRARTRPFRLIARVMIALGVMLGLPFASVNADTFLQIFTGVTVMIAIVEFLLVKADGAALFTGRVRNAVDNGDIEKQSRDDLRPSVETTTTSSSSSSEDELGGTPDEILDHDQVEARFDEDDRLARDGIARQLTRRLETGHATRMVAVRRKSQRKGRRLRALG